MATHKLKATIYDKRGRILSIGYNSFTKSHPYQAILAQKVGLDEKIFLHAEIDAILKCSNIALAYRIVIERYSRLGKPLLSKPCPICSLAIANSPIKIIEHT